MSQGNVKSLSKIRNFDVTVALPGSKSITNRALLLAALADGPSSILHPLRSDDSEAFVESLNEMGATVTWENENVLVSKPLEEGASASVNCRDAGTAARFLPPAAAAISGNVYFDGSDQMRGRPMEQLIDALRDQGVVTDPADATHLPFNLSSSGLEGNVVEVGGDISSQFLSGLLMAAPFAKAPTIFKVKDLISRPYIDLTLDMMQEFGIDVQRNGYNEFKIGNSGRYTAPAEPYLVEADASTASYFFAMAMATKSKITVSNISRSSRQGDLRLLDIFEQMGATITDGPEGVTLQAPEILTGVTVDMSDISDVMMTLACIAPLATGPTHISNVPHARLKESDRISAVVDGMKRLGIEIEEGQDWVTVYPGTPTQSSVDTFHDHRIAMSFTSLGLATGAVDIEDPSCVIKTCPQFFDLVDQIIDSPKGQPHSLQL